MMKVERRRKKKVSKQKRRKEKNLMKDRHLLARLSPLTALCTVLALLAACAQNAQGRPAGATGNIRIVKLTVPDCG